MPISRVDGAIDDYSNIQALQHLQLPLGEEVDSWLSYALDDLPVNASSLLKDGQKLARHTRDPQNTALYDTGEGYDELIQDQIRQMREVDM